MKAFAGLLLALLVAAVLVGDPYITAAAAATALAAAWFLDPRALYATLRVGIVLTLVFAAAITAAVVAWASGPERGIEVGGMVLMRLLVLTVSSAVLVRRVDAEALLRLTDRLGLERLGLVLGLALNALPHVAEASGDVWAAHSLRSRGLGARLRRLPGLGEVLLAHTARIAEEAAAAASLRGHSALTRRGGQLRVPVRTVVVTGPPDGGKTEAVSSAAELIQDAGSSVAGFVQPGLRDGTRKVSFRIHDLATGEEADLAHLTEHSKGSFGTRYRFSQEGFRLGQAALARARPGGILIVDELGPVELRGAGHMPGVRKALSIPGIVGFVVVVRRSLIPSFLAALDASDAVIVDVGEVGEGAGAVIVEALGLNDRLGHIK
jgi:nucleoside-triphosphatase THEP1/energy-coupling factor transporter transmembrane protein EcfT